MKLSVIVCTHNRADYLPLVLDSLDRQLLPRQEFEVVLVDNASTDNTRETVAPWANAGSVRYVHEPKLGLSPARNRGWQEAKGEFIAYLDDDAVAAPDWGRALLEAAALLGPKMGVLGGRIGLIWPRSIPQWLPDELHGYLGALDWGNEQRWLTNVEWIVGANCAFRRSALAALGGFSDDLGRRGKCLMSNEESFLRRRLERAGYLCGYASNAVVWHHVDPSRLNRRWFQRRSYWQGVSSARMEILLTEMRYFERMRHFFFTVLRIARNFVRLVAKSFRGEPPKFFLESCRFATLLGRLQGFAFV
jgi:glycosyltransferase involved in cell wall biosynthesis